MKLKKDLLDDDFNQTSINQMLKTRIKVIQNCLKLKFFFLLIILTKIENQKLI